MTLHKSASKKHCKAKRKDVYRRQADLNVPQHLVLLVYQKDRKVDSWTK